MINYVGNCASLIDWNAVILEIENQTPRYIGPRQGWDDPKVAHIADLWKKHGYKPAFEGGTAEWSIYSPGDHFDIAVVDKFVEFAGMKGWSCAWISKIRPGYCAPWHVDLQTDVRAIPDRIHCHIDTPDPGHLLIVDEQQLINQAQGETYRWSDPELWHAASNVGKKPAYLFNIY